MDSGESAFSGEKTAHRTECLSLHTADLQDKPGPSGTFSGIPGFYLLHASSPPSAEMVKKRLQVLQNIPWGRNLLQLKSLGQKKWSNKQKSVTSINQWSHNKRLLSREAFSALPGPLQAHNREEKA